MIKTRFSPSPTGMLHLGGARTALFSALLAAKSQGIFLLRFEDTDASRSEMKFADEQQNDLHWLDINWQEGPGANQQDGPYFQSQRHDIYAKYYKQLEDMGLVFPCFCTETELALTRKIQLSRGQPPRYAGTCLKLSADDICGRTAAGKKPALRFHVPANTKIEFVDLIRGQQKFSGDDIGDFIIRRADGTSSFIFCNAIDDSLMGITHVIRGDDHLTNTPRQLLILESLKLRAPQYGHLSLITGDDGSPLSKRHGSFGVHDFRQQGFLSKAVLNYLARLSHSYESQKLMTFPELANDFHLEKISRAPARFDLNQLQHWQKETVLQLSNAEVWQWLGSDLQHQVPSAVHDLFAEVMRQNILFPADAKKWADIFFSKQDLNFDEEKKQILLRAGSDFFAAAAKASDELGKDVKAILQKLKNQLNVSGKNLFMPVRVALTGELHGPELPQIANLLGKEKIRERFERARELGNNK